MTSKRANYNDQMTTERKKRREEIFDDDETCSILLVSLSKSNSPTSCSSYKVNHGIKPSTTQLQCSALEGLAYLSSFCDPQLPKLPKNAPSQSPQFSDFTESRESSTSTSPISFENLIHPHTDYNVKSSFLSLIENPMTKNEIAIPVPQKISVPIPKAPGNISIINSDIENINSNANLVNVRHHPIVMRPQFQQIIPNGTNHNQPMVQKSLPRSVVIKAPSKQMAPIQTYIGKSRSVVQRPVVPTYFETKSEGGPRKRPNFSREAVEILRNWYDANLSNPYPDEFHKETLSALTGLSKSQVGNWFINARRRSISKPATS